MTKTRFEALAQAYGGDVTRWPEAERDAALRLLAAQPDLARTVLADALRLDMALDALPAPAAGADLRARVVAAAPKVKARAPWRRWIAGAGVGLTLASACAAGVAMVASAAQPSADDRRADAVLIDASVDVPAADPSAQDQT